MTLAELSLIAKAQVAGEYWYFEAKNWKKAYDLEFIKGGKKDLQIMELEIQKDLLSQKVEEVKPTFWQNPIVITGMVVLAGAGGIWIGAQF